MEATKLYDALIVGGSYAGLSAAMALGRSLRHALIVDSGTPCNKQTPHSHNFITQDGETPAAIAKKAREQVLRYDTVSLLHDSVIEVQGSNGSFSVRTKTGKQFMASKIIFATGIHDLLPDIEGLRECWGISAIHCPYCHGYEVRQEETGILANGDMAYETAKLISNWTRSLTVFTNGPSALSAGQSGQLAARNIRIVEKPVSRFEHEQGQVSALIFDDWSKQELKAIYLRPGFRQHCLIPEQLGCKLTELGHIAVDPFQKTTVPGVYAAGDCSTMMRSVSRAVAEGAMAGAMLNKELIEERF